MSDEFFNKPILNSPYEYPSAHWEMVDGLPTQHIVNSRRKAEFITPCKGMCLWCRRWIAPLGHH